MAKYAQGGYVLTPSIRSMAEVETDHYGQQNALVMACVWQPKKEEIVIFASNVDQENCVELNVDLSCFDEIAAVERIEIYTEDMNEMNTFSEEFCVVPHGLPLNNPKKGMVRETLKPHSWNVLRYTAKERNMD